MMTAQSPASIACIMPYTMQFTCLQQILGWAHQVKYQTTGGGAHLSLEAEPCVLLICKAALPNLVAVQEVA